MKNAAMKPILHFTFPIAHSRTGRRFPDLAQKKWSPRQVSKRGWSTAQGGVAYGCTFRPDQVHNFPLRGSPPSSLPRASMMVTPKWPF